MKNDQGSYEYILIEDIFVNVNQSLFILYYNLYSRAKSFIHFDRPARRKLPSFILRALRVLQFTIVFYKTKKKHHEQASIPMVTSKHYGNCLIKLRQGEYKVFNFKRKLVVTIFPQNMTWPAIEKKVKTIREASKCALAPNLISESTHTRCFTEEYINLSTCSYELINIKKFIIRISPVLDTIKSSAQPKYITVRDYFSDKINHLNALINVTSHKINNEFYISKLREFLDYTVEMVSRKHDGEEVMLVFSHGDLWEGNILMKGKQAYVIDWNTLGYRSFYYDFYYFIFMLAAKNKHFNEVDQEGLHLLNQRLDKCCHLFYCEIRKNKNNVHKNIPIQFHAYRYLFYLELIILKLESTHTSTKNKMKEVLTWIERFKYFEGLRK